MQSTQRGGVKQKRLSTTALNNQLLQLLDTSFNVFFPANFLLFNLNYGEVFFFTAVRD